MQKQLEEINSNQNDWLWNTLWQHHDHTLEVSYRGGDAAPEDVCLFCVTCGKPILDAEYYTVCMRDDIL